MSAKKTHKTPPLMVVACRLPVSQVLRMRAEALECGVGYTTLLREGLEMRLAAGDRSAAGSPPAVAT